MSFYSGHENRGSLYTDRHRKMGYRNRFRNLKRNPINNMGLDIDSISVRRRLWVGSDGNNNYLPLVKPKFGHVNKIAIKE